MSGLIYVLIFTTIILVLSIFNGESKKIGKLNIPNPYPFSNDYANKLHQLSYTTPFSWFIDEEGTGERTKITKRMIAEANLGHVFNYRSFATLKTALLLLSIIVFIVMTIVMNNGQVVMRVLFNIQENSTNIGNSMDSLHKIKIITLMGLLVLCLAPNIILKRRADLYKSYYLQDLPVIQLFIILMLRSKKTVSDILFALSKVNTRYKGVFETGYRIYIRNKTDGFDYIEEAFGETKFKETVTVLRDLGEYSKEESIKLLENNVQQMVEINNSNKRRKDLSKLVYSQSTIAIPFVAVIVLCFIPLVVYGIQIFQNAGANFM